MRKDKWKRAVGNKQTTFAAGLLLLAAVGMTGVYISSSTQNDSSQIEESADERAVDENTESTTQGNALENEKNTEKYTGKDSAVSIEDTTENLQPDVQSDEAAASSADEKKEDNQSAADTTVSEEEKAVETGTMSANLSFSDDSELLWPVQGNVIMDYSMDQTVYFATLDQYKYNPAVVIKATAGEQVLCAADGLIESVTQDAETGCTINMDLGNGYHAVYGQLEELPFKEGAYVKKGEVLGLVSDPTKYYAVEGSNLYFGLTKDDIPVDPVNFFE